MLGGLGCLSCVMVYTSSSVHEIDGKLAQVLRLTVAREHMQTITEEVTRPNGRKVTVVTTRLDGETEAQFVARHDATVAQLMQD